MTYLTEFNVTELGRWIDLKSEYFSKEVESMRKYQIEVTELMNIELNWKMHYKGFSRLDESEERISELEDRIVELT